MKTLIYLSALLIAIVGFVACSNDPAENIAPQLVVSEVVAPDSEDVEENMEEAP